MTKDNHLLGKFELSGIPPAARGVPQIEVTFEIDVNGILNVAAEDKGRGHKEAITITNDKGRLTEEEIKRMIKEAEDAAEDDKAAKEQVEAKNSLENYAYQIKNTLKDDKKSAALDEDDKQTLETEVKQTLDWIDSNAATATKDDFDAEYKRLEKIAQPIFTKLYEKSGQQGGAPGGDDSEENHDEL